MEHGDWLPWLKENFGWARQTADNYMRVADGEINIEAKALYCFPATA
jgi:hypothetical protein